VTEGISPGANDDILPTLNVVMATKCGHRIDRSQKCYRVINHLTP